MADARGTGVFDSGAPQSDGMVKQDGSFHRDVRQAIAALGPVARRPMPTTTAMHLGSWLGWPSWLRDDTSLTCSGPLPSHVSTADDLIIIANILHHAGETAILERLIEDGPQTVGPIAALAFAHAPTLGSGLQSLVRLINVNEPHLRASITVQGERHAVALEPTAPLGRVTNFIALISMASAYRLIAATSFDALDEVELHSTYVDDNDMAKIWRHFRCRVRAGASTNRLSVPSSWCARSHPQSDQNLWALASAQIADAERTRFADTVVLEYRHKVAQILAEQRRVPLLKQIAAESGISVRTISRLFASHGTGFHAMVDQERRLRAATLINDPSLGLPEIAVALGFSDMSSFGRSFRQWFGSSPGKFRRAGKQASGLCERDFQYNSQGANR